MVWRRRREALCEDPAYDSGKYKRIRNNPTVNVAPCNARGKITGPEFTGRARILSWQEERTARKLLIANTGWLVCHFGAARMNTWKLKSLLEPSVQRRYCEHRIG
jgi:PPOX class probable F420-dependent enzyme